MPAARRLLSVSLLAASLWVVGACGGGPTAAQAGAKLAADGRALLGDQPLFTDPKITQAADVDVPCGQGKARRVFTATADFEPGGDPRSAVSINDSIVMTRLHRLGYAFDDKASQRLKLDQRDVVMTKKDPQIVFRVRLQAIRPNYEVRAETACLNAK